MERRFVLVLTVASATLAHAAPSSPEARAEFDRGVAAYTNKHFALAATSLGKSYALEPDTETLFAWAQAERKLTHCDKAIELYTKLLVAADLGAENKREVGTHIEECKAIVAAQSREPEPRVDQPPPVDNPPPVVKESEPSPWWKDPVGGLLVGTGVVGASVGIVFLVQGNNAAQQKETATTYPEYQALYDRAAAKGRLGLIVTASGAALVAAGIVWYATRDRPPARTVTGWLDGSGGGLAIAGGF